MQSRRQRAVLEPGGTLSFLGKEPPPEEARHRELRRRLDHIAQELAQVRAKPASPQS